MGLKGAPDLLEAYEMAQRTDMIHHEVNYTVWKGLDVPRDVTHLIETHDMTTVRASTLMYLLACVIKSVGVKAVLSSEGASEVLGDYPYFHKAPAPQAFHEETVREFFKLYLYDCLCVNKGFSTQGVGGRVPFLDKESSDVVMRLNPTTGICPDREIEKKVVRDASTDMLPESVAQHQKEQFSGGMGYNWIGTLKAATTAAVSGKRVRRATECFPANTLMNKEGYYYRTTSKEYFPGTNVTKSVPSVPDVACSAVEALAWDASFQGKNNPNGRAVAGVHTEAYKD